MILKVIYKNRNVLDSWSALDFDVSDSLKMSYIFTVGFSLAHFFLEEFYTFMQTDA